MKNLFLLLAALALTVADGAAAPSLAERLLRGQGDDRNRAYRELYALDPSSQAALVPHLIPGLAEGQPYVASNAAWALKYLGGMAQPAVPALCGALRDPVYFVRSGAAAALGNLGPRGWGALEALLVTAQDPHPEVRAAALSALGHIDGKDKRVLLRLVDATVDENIEVRRAARATLLTLGFTDRRIDRIAWDPSTHRILMIAGPILKDSCLFLGILLVMFLSLRSMVLKMPGGRP